MRKIWELCGMPNWVRWVVAVVAAFFVSTLSELPFIVALGKNAVISDAYWSVIGSPLALLILYKTVPKAKKVTTTIVAVYFIFAFAVNAVHMSVVGNGDVDTIVSNIFGITLHAFILVKIWFHKSVVAKASPACVKCFQISLLNNNVLKEIIVCVSALAAVQFMIAGIVAVAFDNSTFMNSSRVLVSFSCIWCVAVFFPPLIVIYVICIASNQTELLAWLSCLIVVIQIASIVKKHKGCA